MSGGELQRSLVAPNDTPGVSDSDYPTFTTQLRGFGLELGQQLATTEQLTTENLVYSPLSAAYALAMTYGGARGETAAEMKMTLRDTFAEGVYHTAANRLARELASRETVADRGDGRVAKIELNLAAALFLERTLTVQPTFLDLLAREYDSGVWLLDFRGAHEAARMSINDWVAEQTRDKIKDPLPMGSVDQETPFVLVNALYFYGSWSHPFPHEATSPADFHMLSGEAKQTPTMYVNGIQTSYASAAAFSAAELSYLGGGLSMLIVLPNEGRFEMVRSMVSGEWLAQTEASLEPALLNVALPKFKMTVGFNLTDGLKALGMKQAFTDAADFSGLAPGVKVADVLQKCFIAVDEDGTEAAAATAVLGAPTSAPVDPPIPFVVDRPFLFFIRDKTGAVLFSGQVVDPTKE